MGFCFLYQQTESALHLIKAQYRSVLMAMLATKLPRMCV